MHMNRKSLCSEPRLRPSITRIVVCLLLAILLGISPIPRITPENTSTALAATRAVVVDHQVLPNGLEVYVYEDRTTPVVSVNVWYKAGSRDEPPGLYGMAHLLEHMMFNGSESIPKNGHAQLIDAIGGELNAFTSSDMTVYWNKVPSDQLGSVLELEAERMANLLITSAKVAIEKEVVKEEYRIGFQNDAIGVALDKLLATSLQGTPYAWTPAGTLECIDAITAEDLQGFYEDYYTPSNAILVIAGDTDIHTATHLAQRAFGSIRRSEAPSRSKVQLPEHRQPIYADITMPLQLPTILGGYVIPGTISVDNTALQMASFILSAGQSSRLHQRLVREKGLAVGAMGYAQAFRDAGLFLNLAFYLDNTDTDAVIQAMRDEIEGLVINPPTKIEMAKARNQVAASYAFSLDSLDGIANAIGSAVLLGQGIEEFEQGLDMYFETTGQDIQRVAGRYLRPENLTLLTIKPGPVAEQSMIAEQDSKPQTAAMAEDEDTALEKPILQDLADEIGMSSPQAERISLPPITHFCLSNGLEVYLIHRPQQPIAALHLVLPIGSYSDPEGKAGLANFTAAMLRQGTKNYTAEEISSMIDTVGGSLGAWADDNTTTLAAEVMSKDFRLGLELIADIIINPVFPEPEVESLRQQFLGSLYRRQDNASALATDEAMSYFYGSNHPLGRPVSIDTIQSIQVDDMVAFAEKHHRPDGAILIAAGDIEPSELRNLAETQFGKWSASTRSRSQAMGTQPDPPKQPRLLFIEKPGQTQVQIRMVQHGPTRTTPDWIAIELYNYILGGGSFSSRLMQVVRSELGETYGITTGYRADERSGLFMLATFTSNEKLYETMSVIKAELEEFAAHGVTEEELYYAKANRIGNYPLRFETLGGTTAAIAQGLRFHSLEEVEEYSLLVERLARAEIQAAIARHFDPHSFAIVLLGDPSIMEEVVEVAKLYGIEPSSIDRVDWQTLR
ncbi:MAG: insulinase family protein [Firmicutes bacterium]|nr:insulinase family protein [Bacillota bacterium]